VFVSCVCFVLCRWWLLQQAGYSFRDILLGLPACVYVCVCDISILRVKDGVTRNVGMNVLHKKKL